MPRHIEDLPFVTPLGKTANFYVPAHKMVDLRYGRGGLTPKQLFDEFFLSKFGGLTHEESRIRGEWIADGGGKVFTDMHERYEVSFAGKRKSLLFLNFLSEMCALLEEDSIYLTLGDRSWLIRPTAKPDGESHSHD